MGEARTSDSSHPSSIGFVESATGYSSLGDRTYSSKRAIASNLKSQLEIDHDYRNGKTANSF
jgi:hypothetical protein